MSGAVWRLARKNKVYPLRHALKHMAIDLPSLLKQAAGLRPVTYVGCT